MTKCLSTKSEQVQFCSMCGPKFCSMKISRDIKSDVLAEEERVKGLAEKSAEFAASGSELYVRQS